MRKSSILITLLVVLGVCLLVLAFTASELWVIFVTIHLGAAFLVLALVTACVRDIH